MSFTYKPPDYKQPNPKLELAKNVMSITVNSKDTFPRLRTWIKHYAYKLHKYISPYFKYQMYFELSPKGRLHLHGIVKVRTYDKLIEWYMFGNNNSDLEMNIKIDTIDDFDKWDAYCTKQEMFHQYLATKGLPFIINGDVAAHYNKQPQSIVDQFKFLDQ